MSRRRRSAQTGAALVACAGMLTPLLLIAVSVARLSAAELRLSAQATQSVAAGERAGSRLAAAMARIEHDGSQQMSGDCIADDAALAPRGTLQQAQDQLLARRRRPCWGPPARGTGWSLRSIAVARWQLTAVADGRANGLARATRIGQLWLRVQRPSAPRPCAPAPEQRGRVGALADGRQVMALAGGALPGVANAVRLIDAADGALLWEAGPDALDSPAPWRRVHSEMRDDVLAPPVLADTDGDGLSDRMIFIDRGGAVWRVDLRGDPGGWPVSRLARLGGEGREFLHQPDLIQHRDPHGAWDGIIVASAGPAGNYLFLVKDRDAYQTPATDRELGLHELRRIDPGCAHCADGADDNGWALPLDAAREGAGAALVVDGHIQLPLRGHLDGDRCHSESAGELLTVPLTNPWRVQRRPLPAPVSQLPEARVDGDGNLRWTDDGSGDVPVLSAVRNGRVFDDER